MVLDKHYGDECVTTFAGASKKGVVSVPKTNVENVRREKKVYPHRRY